MLVKKLGVYICIVILFLTVLDVKAQWGAPYTNHWISYGKPYVKILVSQKGLHRLPFSLIPKNFPLNDLAKIQLWHRGKQVSIVSVENNEILFYGIPNDGASDSLLYRPMSSRINPYWSMYSDESSYFLTIGESLGLRSQLVDQALDLGLDIVPYHRAKVIFTFNNQYSLSTAEYLKPDFINSFFEKGVSRTGSYAQNGTALNQPFQLDHLDRTASGNILVKLMLHGRSNANRNIEVSVGKNEKSLRLVSVLNSNGFEGIEYSFELNSSDIDEKNKGVLSIISNSSSLVDRFSLAYYTISYPQDFDAQNKVSYEVELESTKQLWSRVSIVNARDKARVLDVSDVDQPRLIKGNLNDFMISRKIGEDLRLLISSEIISVKEQNVKEISFESKYQTSPNYIIITTENLLDGANQYANYRSSTAGGGYETLVVNIKDIYNQFNFGEPSPVAIRRFVDYMLSEGAKNKYLYIIGNSITYNERMVRELPNEVPTIGFPGSDLLLVEGLAGAAKDVPSLAIGRLPAVTNQNVQDYLVKVKEYENHTTTDLGWRKNILHLNGGKSTNEITQLRNFLSSIAPQVLNGPIGGNVTPFVKQQGMLEVESVNITPEVNNGVGMITYFGHGSVNITDLNFGYVTDVSRGYNNNMKYPMMYFNGCGVGNIFSAKFNPNPGLEQFPLSMDWLLASKKGAIAIIANSFESYVEPSGKYLEQLYKYMFTDTLISLLPIGNIQQEVSKRIILETPTVFNIANVHQSILQGDPAIRVISVPNSDYAVDSEDGIRIYSESADKTIGNSNSLKIKIYLRNLGKFVKTEKIPVNIIFTYKDGSTIFKELMPAFANSDTLITTITNQRNLSKIEVKIDPNSTLKELNRYNNVSELLVDWTVAEKQYFYPLGAVKDEVAPLLNVRFNGKNIKNDEVLGINPVIQFELQDDRTLSDDIPNIEIFLKSCGNNECEFKRIHIAQNNDFHVVRLANNSFEVNYFSSILNQPGIYELLVNSHDDLGNSSSQSYRVRFEIQENNGIIQVTASPNPASSFVRFETLLKTSKELELIEWTIYDLRGTVVERNEIKAPFSLVNEWYWRPKIKISGMYFYKVNFKYTNSEVNQSSGRLLLAN